MKYSTKILRLLTLLLVFGQCKKEEHLGREYPRLGLTTISGIDENGALFTTEFLNRGDNEILEYGYTWDKKHSNKFLGEHVIIKQNVQGDHFSADITGDLWPDEEYGVIPYVKTSDFTIFGDEAHFYSKGAFGPTIDSIFPQFGNAGDTITLIGKNFSYVTLRNQVWFGTRMGLPISSTDVEMKLRAPFASGAGKVNVKLRVADKTITAKQQFEYLAPVIKSVTPVQVNYGDTLFVEGENLGTVASNVSVQFGGVDVEAIGFSQNKIKVRVPMTLTNKQNVLKLTVSGISVVYPSFINLKDMEIFTNSLDTVFGPHQNFTIFGRNIRPIDDGVSVSVDGIKAEIIEASHEKLVCAYPSGIVPESSISVFKQLEVNLTYKEQTYPITSVLHYHSTFTRKSDFPGVGRNEAAAFSLDDKGYYGTGLNLVDNKLYKDFWRYDAQQDQWVRIADFPGVPRYGTAFFSIGNKGYVGTGSDYESWNRTGLPIAYPNDFYEYDPKSNAWTRIADFPGPGRGNTYSFSVKNFGYVGGGEDRNTNPQSCYKFIPADDKWVYHSKLDGVYTNGIGAAIDDRAFLYNYDELYEWDELGWRKINLKRFRLSGGLGFGMNGFVFFGFGSNQSGASYKLYGYDLYKRAWKTYTLSRKYSVLKPSAFVIGNKAYIIGGSTYENGLNVMKKSVWEFDPTLPEVPWEE